MSGSPRKPPPTGHNFTMAPALKLFPDKQRPTQLWNGTNIAYPRVPPAMYYPPLPVFSHPPALAMAPIPSYPLPFTLPLANGTSQKRSFDESTAAGDVREGKKSKPDEDEKWEEQYRILCAYHDVHGDCNVPNRYAPNPSLGWWVANQRAFYCANRLSPLRIQRLEAIGFQWRLRQARVSFHHRCEEYRQGVRNKKLAAWLSRTRDRYLSFGLVASELKMLREAGVEWFIGPLQNEAVNDAADPVNEDKDRSPGKKTDSAKKPCDSSRSSESGVSEKSETMDVPYKAPAEDDAAQAAVREVPSDVPTQKRDEIASEQSSSEESRSESRSHRKKKRRRKKKHKKKDRKRRHSSWKSDDDREGVLGQLGRWLWG